MKIGFGAQLWLMDNHYENFYRMLDEMALIGFDGFETFYPFLLDWYGHKPRELRRLLEMHGLELSSYYTGLSFSNAEARQAGLAEFRRRCQFLAEVGGENVLLDGGDKHYQKDFPDVQAYIRCIADGANELGEYARSLGLTLSWHQHWGSVFEEEDNLALLMEQTDPAVVGFCCDVAQVTISGFDPVETVRRYLPRIRFMHYKDATRAGRPQGELWKGYTVPSDEGAYNVDSKWRMVELGRGEAPLKAVTEVLLEGGYDGWLVDDYDFSGYPAAVAAQACKDYINHGLGIWGERDLRENRRQQP